MAREYVAVDGERDNLPRVVPITGDDPVGFSVSRNVYRRHLTAGQRAAVAVEALPLFEAEAAKRVGGRPKATEEKPPADRREVKARESTEQAAKSTGASGRSVARFKRVADAAPDLADKVKAGMAFDRAERVIRDREAETRRVAQARAEAAEAETPSTVDIRHGDFLADLAYPNAYKRSARRPPHARSRPDTRAVLSKLSERRIAPYSHPGAGDPHPVVVSPLGAYARFLPRSCGRRLA